MAFFRSFPKIGTSSMKIILFNKSAYSNVKFLTTSSRFLASAANSGTTTIKKRDGLDTSFNDPIAAFKSKTTFELIRAYFVYLLCSSEFLVEHNMKVSIFTII